jgi:hypothetical protein
MGTLSKAAHVPFLKNTLVYIPDNPALGEYRSKFKNHLVLMEEREPPSSIAEGKKENPISTKELMYKLKTFILKCRDSEKRQKTSAPSTGRPGILAVSF